jgi:hypothetical protein
MFPSRFDRWLDQNLSDLAMVKGSETHLAPERLCGARMDIQWGQRVFLVEAINAHVGVLQRGNRTSGQLAHVEIVPAANKGGPLRSSGAAVG